MASRLRFTTSSGIQWRAESNISPRQGKRGLSSMWTAGTSKPSWAKVTSWRLEQGAVAGHVQRVGFVLAERRVVVARGRARDTQFGCGVLEPEHGDARLARETYDEASDGSV